MRKNGIYKDHDKEQEMWNGKPVSSNKLLQASNMKKGMQETEHKTEVNTGSLSMVQR